MLFRRSSFQFYAYAIGLIAVPLRRFTIPMHCPAIQCRCHPMQFSSAAIPCFSLAIRRPTILCPCLSNQRFSAAFPIQSGPCYSDATLTGSPHFLCWPELFSSLLHHSSAQPFHTIPTLIISFQRSAFPAHRVSLHSFASANLLSAIPALIRATPSPFPALRSFSITVLLRSTPFLSVSIRYFSNAQLLSALPMPVVAIRFLCWTMLINASVMP